MIFQLRDRALCSQIFAEVVAPYLADTEKTRVLMPTGEYVRRHARRSLGRADNNGRPFNAQEFLIEFARSRQSLDGFPSLPAFMRMGRSATATPQSD